MSSKPSWLNITSLVVGFSFLYLPIVILIVFSFNDSQLGTVWSGFSTRWYDGLLQNEQLMQAVWVTLRIGFASATLATVLGTLAALVLVRQGRFLGRTLFSGMIYAPLVMPEVILGLSLVLLFVAMDQNRGSWTIMIAHTTFSMCYVAVIVQSRLSEFDRSLEEAAMDLGCPPVRTFFLITLPQILPGVLAGWMLAFTLSLNDLVIASFNAGAETTTLPMRIYGQAKLGGTPEINAISTILILLMTVGVILASVLTKRQRLKRMEEERLAAAHL